MDEDKNNSTDSSSEQRTASADTTKPKIKKDHKKLVITLVVVLLLAGLGWLYFNEKQTSDDLRNQLVNHEHTEDNGTEVDDPAPSEEVASTDTSKVCDEGSMYTAAESNVELTLGEGYVIILNHDSGFEGGPVTKLTAATCVDDQTGNENIIASPLVNEVEVQSLPSNGSTTFFPQNPEITTEKASIKVDGKTAKVFVESGLFETVYIFVSHEGYNTTITGYYDGSGNFDKTTKAVLDGLKFVST